jgi:hypothetical protein
LDEVMKLVLGADFWPGDPLGTQSGPNHARPSRRPAAVDR